MTVIRTDGVAYPPAKQSGGVATSQQDDSEKRTAWLREMEKQQMASWLNHGPLPASARKELAARLPTAWQPTPARTEGGLREQPEPPGAEAKTMGSGSSEGHGPLAEDNRMGKASNQGADGHTAAAQADRLPGAVSAAPIQTAGEPDAAVERFVAQVMTQANVERAAVAPPALSVGRESFAVPGEQAAAVKSVPAAMALPSRAMNNAVPAEVLPETAAEAEAAPGHDEQVVAREQDKSSYKSSDPPPPMRIHAFWSAESVRVWIGADHSVALDEQQLAYALQGLRKQLRQQGATLASFTVNGETLFSQSEEDPGNYELPGVVGARSGYGPAQYALGKNNKGQERQ